VDPVTIAGAANIYGGGYKNTAAFFLKKRFPALIQAELRVVGWRDAANVMEILAGSPAAYCGQLEPDFARCY
jgi:hypothetical protein